MTMKVPIRFFARARDLAGNERVELELPQGARIGELRILLGEAFPALRPMLGSMLFAVGTDYVTDRAAIPAGREVVCFPPVSGG